MKKLINNKYLIIIFIFGLLIRVVALNLFPISLNWDEVSHGYNAYSLLKTGHDQWGQFLPLINFRAYGDYPLPLNLYLTVPFIFIFGLTQSAIRLPHALLGSLTIFSVYFFVNGVTKNKKISLIACLLAATEPWFLFPSRAVFQSNLSVFFLITFAALFFNREKNRWFLPFSFLSLGFTLFSYHSTRIFTPILLVFIIIFYFKEILKSKLSVLLILLFFLPLPFIFLNPESRARSNVVFILNDSAIAEIESLRNSSDFVYKNIIYNRVTYFGVNFAKNYINYFSPEFLFMKGGTQFQFSVPDQGVMYLITLPFFYLGLVLLFLRAKKSEDKKYKFILLWLLLGPVPAAITQDKSAVIRATTMLPIPEIAIALGFIFVTEKLNKYKSFFIYIFVAVLLVSFINYANIYINSYKTQYSWSWQYGYREVADFINQNYENYDDIILTKKYGEPHEFMLFYLKYDPNKYLTDKNKITYYQSNWWWVDRFDKFWFVNDWQVKDLAIESGQRINCASKKCLLITTPNNFPASFNKTNEIRFLDGKTVFEMYTN